MSKSSTSSRQTLSQIHAAQRAIYQRCARVQRENLSVEVGQLRSPNNCALKYTTVTPAEKLTRELREAARADMHWDLIIVNDKRRAQWRLEQPEKWCFNVGAYRTWARDKQIIIETRLKHARETLAAVHAICDEINDLALEFYHAYEIDWRVPTVLISNAAIE